MLTTGGGLYHSLIEVQSTGLVQPVCIFTVRNLSGDRQRVRRS